MKLTKQDQELFKALQDSQIGVRLVDFLERFKADLADVRTLLQGEDPRSRIVSLKKIDEEIIDRIRIKNDNKKVNTNEYE